MAYGIAFEFLDVGMGDGTLVQLPPWDKGVMCLVDFGERGSPFRIPARDATKFLIKRIADVTRAIDPNATRPYLPYLFLTHGDRDHYNKMEWLIEGKTDIEGGMWKTWGWNGWPANTTLRIGEVHHGGEWDAYDEGTIAQTIETAAGGAAHIHEFPDDAYSRIDGNNKVIPFISSGGANIYVLCVNYPARDSEKNGASLVLMFEHGNFKAILPGDIPKLTELNIIKNFTNVGTFLQSTALKLAHHGSASSSSDEWLAAVRPKLVFATGDKRWGHPYCAPITRAKNVGSLATDIHKHWTSCSQSGLDDISLDYTSDLTQVGVCTNLWYVVKRFPGLTAPDWDDVNYTGQFGLYTGVQWRLQYDPDIDPNTFHITSTNAWPKAQALPPQQVVEAVPERLSIAIG